jgi:hypothetical protein
MAVIIFLVIQTGCESYLVHEGAPSISNVIFGSTCGGSEVVISEWYEGNTVQVGVDFSTSNVGQEFDAAILIESDTVPDDMIPEMLSKITFTTLSQKPGSAKGVKRVTFGTTPKCKSSGIYQLTIVITDANGDSDTKSIGFAVTESVMFGGDPCKCVTQCGQCIMNFGSFERCNCGCPFVGERCS